MTRAQKATDLMLKDNFSCSQAVLEVFCDDFGVDVTTARKLSAMFGGGLKRGGVCGVLTGGLMVLGLRYGQTVPNDLETKKASGPIAREFLSRFEAKGHRVDCETLLGVNSSTPEGAAYVKEKDLHRVVCADLVKDSVEILEDMLGL
ncbi:MAG TPA: C-GCAxxG-C-C family protein [Terriglobales bacterium]|nr:C-GCAxxG-C-C family protein [Terriglobales bacterium]